MRLLLPFVYYMILGPILSMPFETAYAEDIPGKFIRANQRVKYSGPGYPALVKSVTASTGWFQLNQPPVKSPKGFNANESLFGNSLPADKNPNYPGYIGMFSINLSFYYSFVEVNVEKTTASCLANSIGIRLNQVSYELARPPGVKGFGSGNNQSLKQETNQAHDPLQYLCSLKLTDTKLKPGVELYTGDQLLVSNPYQPAPWILVSPGELTQAITDHNKIRKANNRRTD